MDDDRFVSVMFKIGAEVNAGAASRAKLVLEHLAFEILLAASQVFMLLHQSILSGSRRFPIRE
jgi:hypothetical protein